MKTCLKYVGSKSGLVEEIQRYVPRGTTVIVEPFAGSGSFSFASGQPFYLMDNQAELVNFWTMLKDYPEELISELTTTVSKHSEEFYMEIRGKDRLPNFGGLDTIERAARYYYIIYAGFNGLYRVNKKNQCNTPTGKRNFSTDNEKLIEVSEYLNHYCMGIHHMQFDDMSVMQSIVDSGEKPFVLIDPPYVDGDNGKKVYREYTNDTIDDNFYNRLKAYMEDLERAGIPFVMTNTYCEYIKEKFSNWTIDKVVTSYKVAADKSKRGEKFEAFTSNSNRDHL